MIITYDGSLLFDARLKDYRLFSAKLNQELNKADSLTFLMYPDHPAYSAIERLKSTIAVSDGSAVKSRCRLLDDTLGWENGKECVCEGELAFFHDSIQRPFTFPVDDQHTTPADLFEFLITRHNAQVSADRRFVVGNCTVTDPNGYITRSDTEYSTTWTLLNEQLINTLGGFLWVRHENGQSIIDYLADFSTLANQPIQAGLNLLSIKTERRGAEIATAILPLGAEEDGVVLTIEDLPDSETTDICKDGDIVYSKAAETLYGSRIVAVVRWDDVTLASNLLTKATAELGTRRLLPSTVTLTAADLSAAGYNYNSFALGTYVQIFDDWHSAHGLLATYLVKSLSIDLLDPANNTLTLGATTLSFTEASQKNVQTAMQTVETNVTQEMAVAIREVETQTQTAIQQSAENIIVTMTEQTYLKGEVDDMVSSLQTSINTTAKGIDIRFTSIEEDIDDVAAGADAKFNSLQSYIQMAGGSITLGKVGNQITLKLENNEIGIYANGVKVTYWNTTSFVSPQALTIPVDGRLNLGSFAFIPRSSGSLDFTWVGE